MRLNNLEGPSSASDMRSIEKETQIEQSKGVHSSDYENLHSATHCKHVTSRERPKLALYLRLKIVKGGTLRAL